MQALSVRRASGDRAGEAATGITSAPSTRILGSSRRHWNTAARHWPSFESWGTAHVRPGRKTTLARPTLTLGDKQQALEHFMGALEVLRALGDRVDEAAKLENVGTVYDDLGDSRRHWTTTTRRCSWIEPWGPRSRGHKPQQPRQYLRGPWEKQKALEYYNQALADRASGG